MDNNQKSSILPPGQTRTPTIVTQNNSSKMPRPEDIDLRNKLLPTIAGSEFQNSTPQREKKPPSRIRAILTEPCGPKNLYILRLAGWLLCLFISWGLLYTLLHDEGSRSNCDSNQSRSWTGCQSIEEVELCSNQAGFRTLHH
uniref:Uncharacterized protein n=1 Tax=Cacopsylla melanoneura TaxID=428564 RepID=A0A8D9A3K0_9HEMI